MVLDNMQFQLLVSPNSHALYIYLEFGLNLVSKEHDLLKCITIQFIYMHKHAALQSVGYIVHTLSCIVLVGKCIYNSYPI